MIPPVVVREQRVLRLARSRAARRRSRAGSGAARPPSGPRPRSRPCARRRRRRRRSAPPCARRSRPRTAPAAPSPRTARSGRRRRRARRREASGEALCIGRDANEMAWFAPPAEAASSAMFPFDHRPKTSYAESQARLNDRTGYGGLRTQARCAYRIGGCGASLAATAAGAPAVFGAAPSWPSAGAAPLEHLRPRSAADRRRRLRAELGRRGRARDGAGPEPRRRAVTVVRLIVDPSGERRRGRERSRRRRRPGRGERRRARSRRSSHRQRSPRSTSSPAIADVRAAGPAGRAGGRRGCRRTRRRLVADRRLQRAPA